MRGGMLLSSASADVALDAGADEPAEALCEGGSCHGNHGFTRGAPLIRIFKVSGNRLFLRNFLSDLLSKDVEAKRL
jgi:hypothetical protein